MPSPRALALPGVHDAVLAALLPLPRGRLLDVPAGEGALAAAAASAGFEVVAADVAPERYRADRTCERVDLDAPLPWPDASFDVVVCAEGIEHVENHFATFRELTRVLRPGGHLVLSTPNPLSLSARMSTLFTGFHDVAPYPIRTDEARLSNHHINPLALPQLELLCRRNGLEIEDVRANRLRRGAIALAVMLGPWIALATWWHLRGRNRPAPMPDVHARVRRLLLSPAGLFGRVVVVRARREG